MTLEHLEQLLQTLPKARLSSESDLSIRTLLISKASVTPKTPEAREAFPSWFSLPRLLYVPALATLVLVGSTSAYAYTSSNITRTSPLYPLRRAVEKIVYPQTNAANAISIALRRAQEAETLAQMNPNEAIVPTLREVGVATAHANIALSKLEGVEELERSLKKTDHKTRSLNETLNAIAATVDTQNSSALDETAIALATTAATLEQIAAAELDVDVARAEGKHKVIRVLVPHANAESLDGDADELAAALEVATQDFKELETLLTIRTRPVVRTRQVRAHVEQRLTAAIAALGAGNLAQANAMLTAAAALIDTGEKFLAEKENRSKRK